ncbi:MAG: sensor histidine kinase [Clostridia bacterium]|nr:sensor histidine kinase [Clostridia bacterium]
MNKKKMKRAFFRILKNIKFSNLALRQKLLFVHILLLIVPLLLLYYYVSGIYIQEKKNEALSSSDQFNQISMSNIDNYIQQIQEMSKQPLYDKYVISSLIENNNYQLNMRPGIENLQNDNKAIDENLANTYLYGFMEDDNNTVSRLANRIMAFSPYIHSVFIVDLQGKHIYRIVDNALIKPYTPIYEEWYKTCLALEGKALLISSFNFNDYIEQRGDKFFVFSIARAIKNPLSTETVGTIIININQSYLDNFFSGVKLTPDERILITDENNSIVYDSLKKDVSKSIIESDFDMNALGRLNLEEKYNTVHIGSENYAVVTRKSEVSNWKLIRLIPEKQLYSDVLAIQNRMMIFLAFFVAFSLILSVSISYGVTKPLSKMILTMKAIEKGDLSLRFKVRHKDEVGQLGRNFNKMIKKIDNLVNIVYVSKIRKRETELNALQAQINPHFIYNTLESIRRMAEINDDEPTSKMTYILGKLLRYSINIKNKAVTIKEEIEHLQNYILLQNYRYGNRFELHLDIPDELYSLSVIKLVFQPIVENALYHGLEMVDEKGTITVHGYRTVDKICFDIKDNGIGMTPLQLEQLVERTNDFSAMEEGSKGIGLRNINERIRLHYGDEYGIKIASEYGKGTTVTIELPVTTL